MKKYNELADQLELAKRGQLNLQDRDGDSHEMLHHARRHTDHCFRYLRQSIVCCGDTALEGQNPKAPIPDTDGTGAVHLCKDFERLKRWAEERRVVDTHGV
jgi:glyoxylase-like metal-dependent hydrolase (beta-lactamase superfamily II)